MNWIIRYFKKQRLLSKIKYHLQEIESCDYFLGFSHIYFDEQLRAFMDDEIKENRDKMLQYLKQLKELEK